MKIIRPFVREVINEPDEHKIDIEQTENRIEVAETNTDRNNDDNNNPNNQTNNYSTRKRRRRRRRDTHRISCARCPNIETLTGIVGIFSTAFSFAAFIDAVSLIASGHYLLTEQAPHVVETFESTQNKSYPQTWDNIIKLFFSSKVPPVLISFALSGIIFSVLLLIGVEKKKRNYIKAFIVYGIIIVFLCNAYGATCNLLVDPYGFRHDFPIIGTSYLSFHLFFLLAVFIAFLTFKKFKMIDEQFSHIILDNVR